MRYAIPSNLRDADAAKLSPELIAQTKLSVLLGHGFALSLLVTGGLSSLAALAIGLLVLKRIRASGGRLVGRGLAWWCVVAGGIGAVAAPSGTVALLAPFAR